MKWAIQDSATGEWWTGNKWSAHDVPWRDKPADLARSLVFDEEREDFRATACIVPEPNPEMTDNEAWQWFRTSNLYLHAGRDLFFVNRHSMASGTEAYAIGISPEDTFRAARKKKEKEDAQIVVKELEQCAALLELRANAIDSSRKDAQIVLREMAEIIRERKR